MKDSKVVQNVAITGCDPDEPICLPWQNVPVAFDKVDDIINLHPNCTGVIVPVGIQKR
jgi:hypothetical protein